LEFDPYTREFQENPYGVYRWLRDAAPVYHSESYGFWALSRFADVNAAHRDIQRFINGRGLEIADMLDPDFENPGFLNTTDPPGHPWLRKLVSRAFTPRAIAAFEPMIRQVTSSLLDPLMDRDEFDIQADFSLLFTNHVINRIVGVPNEESDKLREWAQASRAGNEGSLPTGEDAKRAAIERHEYFVALVHARRARPTDDLASQIVGLLDEEEAPTRLSDDQIGNFVAQFVMAGVETTAMAIGNGVVLFGRHPEQWQKVLDDGDRIPNAVEEIIRYWAPVQYIGRFCTTPTTFEGGTIPGDAPVYLFLGAASRDPREHKHPDTFDIERKIPVALSLGVGIHSCIGAALARTECRVAFEEIRTRWPTFEVDEAGLRRLYMNKVSGYANIPMAVKAR
jgi:cytochrome P450